VAGCRVAERARVVPRPAERFAEGGGQRLKEPTRFHRKGDWNAPIACMCLCDGGRRRSRGWLRGPAWPRWGGGWWPTGDVASGSAHGPSGGADAATPDAAAAPDAGSSADAAASPDAGPSADAVASPDAAADAASQHGWHAGAAAEFPAAQHGGHAQHVATVAAKCRCSAGPWNTAAARHGIAATGFGIDGSGRNVRPRCRRHESAGRIAREHRRHDQA